MTEYACHRDYLESHDCRLTNEQHDITVDLTHLTHSCESSYRTKGALKNVYKMRVPTDYEYFM